MILWFAGMIKGETEGDEATRAVVKAAKAVAGGSLLCHIVNTRGSSEHCYIVTLSDCKHKRLKQRFYLLNIVSTRGGNKCFTF